MSGYPPWTYAFNYDNSIWNWVLKFAVVVLYVYASYFAYQFFIKTKGGTFSEAGKYLFISAIVSATGMFFRWFKDFKLLPKLSIFAWGESLFYLAGVIIFVMAINKLYKALTT